MKTDQTLFFSLFLLTIVGGGLLLIVFSLMPLATGDDIEKALRAGGFSLIFFGIGEYLNHPSVPRLRRLPLPVEERLTTRDLRRDPCTLGNLLDVLAIICAFVAASYFFFPYRG